MPALPTGTVTFLFTDIEGSTALAARLGDPDYAEVLAEHRRLLRDAFRKGGGREISTQGDSFLVAFNHARDGVATAVAAQRAITTHQWPHGALVHVRMGLHTGEPLSAQSGYVGIDLHRAARICGAGHGGQILISDATRVLVENNLPAGMRLRDLGEHRLPGLSRPQHIFQVIADNVPGDFPPLKSLVAFRNNLPIQLTSFIGRANEIGEVKRLLFTTPLLTLTGSGGAGKTRLALRVAAEVLPLFEDGVWLVELGSLSEPSLVTQTAASALNVREQPGEPMSATLTNALQTRHLLLILDNCEHLVKSCADLAYGLLRSCRNLRILATSREPLRVAGETSWRVPSLSLPDPRDLPSLEDLTQYEAVRLLIERARSSLPSFTLTKQNAPHVLQICRRLDGIPLAIELAAARVRVLSVEQVARRLDDRFHLLTNGSRTAPPRSQTLQAAVDWSFNLLSDPERVLMRRLSVFAGGFTLEAAEAICAGDGIGTSQILDLLTQLLDKSLVSVENRDEDRWYRLLETVRQFSLRELLGSGEVTETRRRHRDWYLGLAERAEPEFLGTGQSAWYDRLEAEHDNLRDALEWSLNDGDHGEAERLAGALYWFWHVRGYFTEGRGWLDKALSSSRGASAHARAKALFAAASLAREQHDSVRVKALAQASHILFRELSDEHGIVRCVILFGFMAMDEGDYERAKVYLEQGLSLCRKLGDKMGIGIVLNNLGEVARCQGDYVAARSFYEQALPLRQELRDERGVAVVLDNLGRVARHLGDFERADVLLKEALSMRWRMGFKFGIATSLAGMAGMADARMQPARAARLLGAAETLLSSLGAYLYRADRLEHDRTVATVQATLGEGSYTAMRDEGRAMTLEKAIEYALAGDA